MPILSKRFLAAFCLTMLLVATCGVAQRSAPATAAGPNLDFPTVLYGAAYYNEYMPGDDADHAARLVRTFH